MMKVDDKVRVVAAVVHQDTTEVEIILEITTNVGNLNDGKDTLRSIWIDCEELCRKEDNINDRQPIFNQKSSQIKH